MSDPKIEQSLVNLEAALDRLEEALQEPEANRLAVDGTIQRFEFVIELYWKTFRRLLQTEKIQVTTPKESMKQAYAAGWISDADVWLDMLDDRNATSHVYKESQARQIYERIKAYYPELARTYDSLKERSGS